MRALVSARDWRVRSMAICVSSLETRTCSTAIRVFKSSCGARVVIQPKCERALFVSRVWTLYPQLIFFAKKRLWSLGPVTDIWHCSRPQPSNSPALLIGRRNLRRRSAIAVLAFPGFGGYGLGLDLADDDIRLGVRHSLRPGRLLKTGRLGEALTCRLRRRWARITSCLLRSSSGRSYSAQPHYRGKSQAR